ncbi:MAG: oligosaccharide flippase family protein [Clostridia bacterium]|nr:oligosaccharide flippase family protein [Clostridia bacterium]
MGIDNRRIDNKTVLKSGVWYTISNFLTKGILFLSTPIFTRMLGQEGFGAFNNFSSWLSILIIVVTLTVEATLMSARRDYADCIDKYIFSALGLSTASCLVWAVLFNLFMPQVSAFMNLKPLYINVMLVYLLFYAALHLFQAQEGFLFRYKVSATLSMVCSIGACLLSVAIMLVVPAEGKLDARIYGHMLPTILVGAVLFVILARRGRRVDVKMWPYTLKVCLPFAPHLLSMTVLNSTDRIMITAMRGEVENALYSVAYNVAMVVTLLLNSLNSAYSPWLAHRLMDDDYASVRKVGKYYICLFLGLGLGLLLVAPEVLLIMGGQDYVVAKPIMIPIAIGCMCQGLYTMFVNIEQFYKKTVGMAVASATAAALNYGLNLWLIPKFGYVAAAYTTLIGYLWLLAIHMLLVRLIKKHHIYSYKFVFAAVAFLGILIVAMTFIYQSDVVRYICLAVYVAALGFAAWRFRGQIRSFIKK